MSVRARTIVITGANRGLGLEMVRQLVSSDTPPQHLFAACRDPDAATVRIKYTDMKISSFWRNCHNVHTKKWHFSFSVWVIISKLELLYFTESSFWYTIYIYVYIYIYTKGRFIHSYSVTVISPSLCWFDIYRHIYSIRRTKLQNWCVYRLVLPLSLPNPLKPDIKSRMKVKLEQRRQAMLQLHLSDQHFYKGVLYQRFDNIWCNIQKVLVIALVQRLSMKTRSNWASAGTVLTDSAKISICGHCPKQLIHMYTVGERTVALNIIACCSITQTPTGQWNIDNVAD